jgi:pimeloyl-ACP methyl ester carboxylesterase
VDLLRPRRRRARGRRHLVRAIERQLAGPVETMLVEDAGHAPFRDQPAIVHARIAEFVLRHAG